MSIGDFPEYFSQAMLVGIMSVGRLGVWLAMVAMIRYCLQRPVMARYYDLLWLVMKRYGRLCPGAEIPDSQFAGRPHAKLRLTCEELTHLIVLN